MDLGDAVKKMRETIGLVRLLPAFKQNKDNIQKLVDQGEKFLSAYHGRISRMHTVEYNEKVSQQATDMWDNAFIDGLKDKEASIVSLLKQLQDWYDENRKS